MIKSKYNVIGVMSGTSLDGIDLAFISFDFNSSWSFKIIEACTIPYSKKWISRLANLVNEPRNIINLTDIAYTEYLGDVIKKFIEHHKLEHIDAVCSHGHTALHQPEEGFTYQIGNHPRLASILKLKVICDFRVQDVELGGQGAPLVPIGDDILFSTYDYCLNLGGFANISFARGNDRIAFDICPVNIVLNHYSKKMGFDFDPYGKFASEGEVDPFLLDALNSLEFYQMRFPKSLGLEWVNSHVFPLIESFKLDLKTILRTFVEHIVIQISMVLTKQPKSSVLITGGGVYNSFLIKRLKTISTNSIDIPSKDIIEYKEALIFGLLGVLKLRNEVNCLASVTGAKYNHSSGSIYNP